MNLPLYALYDDQAMAEQVQAKLVAAGVKRRAIQLMTLSGDERDHVGSFGDAGAHGHDEARDHVGSFGDAGAHGHDEARDHVGSFGDAGAHGHDEARDHVGSFAAHKHPDDVLRDLARAGLADADARACLARLAAGATLVLARPDDAQHQQAAVIMGV